MVTITRFPHYGNRKRDNDKVTGMSHEPVQKLIILLELETLDDAEKLFVKTFSERICVSEYLNLKRCICYCGCGTQKRMCKKKRAKEIKANTKTKGGKGELNQLHKEPATTSCISTEIHSNWPSRSLHAQDRSPKLTKDEQNAILYGVSVETDRGRERERGDGGSGHWSC